MPKAYTTFGGYILFKELLDDELGHLYRAAEFDKDGIKRTAFLRTFDAAAVPKEDVLGALEDATKIGKILQAANVAPNPVYSSQDGVPAVAFDFVAAQPLSRVFEKVHEEGFPVPVDNALLIMEKLALALSAALTVEAGGRALVHGFLHPSLMLVSNDGEGLVAGFGFADQLLGLVDNAEMADAIHPYLAPELLMTRNAGKRADVYSLGAILYQLLTGQRIPTKPEDRAGILDSAELAYDERPIPDDIKGLLQRALAQQPESRFSSAADFKKELDKLLYGGAYSPTTFNLALFMDRLFRAEIELEEKDRETEAAVDFAEYLAPEPEPEPEPEMVAVAPAAAKGGNKGLLIGGLVVIVAAIIGVGMMIGGGGDTPQLPPTPNPEQVAEKKAADEQRLRELAAQMVEERMQQREEELRAEMEDRQKKIDELQKKLKDTEKSTTLSAADKKKRDDLQRQIAAEQEAKRQREAEAEAERQKALAQAQQEAAARQAQAATATAAAQVAAVQPTVPPPTNAPQAQPTAAPVTPAEGAVTITENMFLHPSEVDTLPVIVKEEKVKWSRVAMRSNKKGMIIVQATVDASGKVEAVTVLRADEEGYDIPEAVIDAVKKYRFKPATKTGIRVKSYATVTARFNFRNR